MTWSRDQSRQLLIRLPLWTLASTTALSAALIVVGAFRSFYFGGSLLESLSYFSDERVTAEIYSDRLGVDPDSLLTGVHVFADFLIPFHWATLANPWIEDVSGYPVNYPPPVMLVMKIATLFPYQNASLIAVALMAVAMVLPMVIALWSRDGALAVLGGAVALLSAGSIATLDRGNLQGLIPILLFGFGTFALKNRWGWATAFSVAAISIKPFFVLLLLIYVAERKWRPLAAAFLALTIAFGLSFLLFPGNAFESFAAWVGYALFFTTPENLTGFLTYNNSPTGGLAHWAAFLGMEGLAEFVFLNARAITLGLAVLLLIPVFLTRRLTLPTRLFLVMMASTAALPLYFPYAANWVIAGAAVLFWSTRDPSRWWSREEGSTSGETKNWAGLVLLLGLMAAIVFLLAVAPVFIPGSQLAGYPAGVSSLLSPLAVASVLVGVYASLLRQSWFRPTSDLST